MRNRARNRPRNQRFRLTVGFRLLLALAGLVSLSTVAALVLQDRALARDLEQAAAARLDRAARGAQRLVAGHVEALEERYRAVSGTPQMRASLEVRHAPTLAYYASGLREREEADLLVFVDTEDRVIAFAGDESLVPTAVATSRSGLAAHERRPYFAISSALSASGGVVGRMIALHSVDAERLARWSDLCGAPLHFGAPSQRADLAQVVTSLAGLELRVDADLEAERAALRHSRTNLILAGAASLALSLFAAGMFARSFVRPIRAIQHATERIRGGDLATRLASERRDEIGDVARAFDAMLDDLHASQAQVAANLAELTRSRIHLDNAQRRARLGSFEVDLQSGAIEGSSQLRELFQLEDEGKPLVAAQIFGRVHPDDRSDLEETLRQALRQANPMAADFRLVLPDDAERVLHGEAYVVRDADDRAVRLEGTVQDVTERRRAERQIEYLAYRDGLTGLGNRRLFGERLDFAIERAGREGHALGILFLDLDHFKRINDTLGHTLGDELLRGVAARLTQCVRSSDVVSRVRLGSDSAISRLGGDEFTVLVDRTEDPQGLSHVAGRILEALSGPFDLSGHEVVVSASIGIAVYPVDGEDADALMRNADSAMYHAKEHGRNQCQFYTESMNAAAVMRLELEQRMRTGLLAGELEVHYQPKLDLRSQCVAGFEALVRWRDPARGLVSPGDFIPVAEQSGLIVAIGRAVLERVCAQVAKWERSGAWPPGVERVSVNVSARQFQSGQLVATIREILESTGASPQRLELEITESTVMHDERVVVATLDELRGLGVAVSLDDFGTGYSSLAYLRSLPVDTLKIDMAFVRNIATHDEDAALTAAIVSMGKARGLRVVAEGVETVAQRRLLEEFGCDQIQGFLIAPALPVDEATRLCGVAYGDGAPTAYGAGAPGAEGD